MFSGIMIEAEAETQTQTSAGMAPRTAPRRIQDFRWLTARSQVLAKISGIDSAAPATSQRGRSDLPRPRASAKADARHSPPAQVVSMSSAPLAPYPALRLRRLRQADWIRRLVREHTLTPADLIWSIVVHEGGSSAPVASMPGVERLSRRRRGRGGPRSPQPSASRPSPSFPTSTEPGRTPRGSMAADPDGLVARAVKAMKDAAPEVGVMCDVALDPVHRPRSRRGDRGRPDPQRRHHRTSGRAGSDAGQGRLRHPRALRHDGRSRRRAQRRCWRREGLTDTLIMSYAAKYASAFYGPYREAIGSAKLGAGGATGRQEDLSDGSGQRRRGPARGRPGYRRGRRHGHGQAGPALSRHRPPGGRGLRHADLRVPGDRRIRDDPRRRPGGLDRRGPGDPRKPDRVQARRGAGVITYFAPGRRGCSSAEGEAARLEVSQRRPPMAWTSA